MSIWAKKWAYEQHPVRIDEYGHPTEKKHPAAKAILVALAEFPGPGQRCCWPAQETLANMTDFSVRQVRACMSDLEKQKLIKRTHRHRKDGTRRSDIVELLGPIKEFGPPQDGNDQPEHPAGSQPAQSAASQPEQPAGHEPSYKEPSGNSVANATPCGRDASASPTTGSKKKKGADAARTREKQRQAQEAYDGIVSSHGQLGKKLAYFVEGAALVRNKTGTLKPTTKLRDYGEPFLEALEKLGPEAVGYGLDTGIRNQAKTFPYVVAAAQGYDPAVHERFRRGARSGRGRDTIAVTNASENCYEVNNSVF